MNQAAPRRQETATLLRLISEWRALAERQTEAIQRSDWPEVAHLSEAKEKLKELMDSAISTSGMTPCGERPPELQSVIEELERLEQHNHHLLSERSCQTQSELEQSHAETQRLRQIRNAYQGARQARWHSYL